MTRTSVLVGSLALFLGAGLAHAQRTEEPICSMPNADMKQTPLYLDPDADLEDRVDDVVSRMTLEEKVSQMLCDAAAVERLGIPEYNWWNEALHGVARVGRATVFPQAIGLAAAWDIELMLRVATAISDEARAKHHESVRLGRRGIYEGLTFWSPNINIFRDPRWGRGMETYGEDPYLTGRLGVEFVRGLHGDHPFYLKAVATPKHYAVHSGPEPDRHTFDGALPLSKDLATIAVIGPNADDADVLLGNYNPAGRLPITYYESVDQLPPFSDNNMAGKTYRYFEGEPLFPFGHGLSYTRFEYTNLQLPARIRDNEDVVVTVEVRNTGELPGEEGVQLYVTDLEASVPVPIRSLQGFKRVFLEPGTQQTVTFTLHPRQLSLIDAEWQRVVEPGVFEISVGGKQPGFSGLADARTTGVVVGRFEVVT